jgi:transposase-like protein
MPRCKNRGSERSAKNGKTGGKQRHRCAGCGHNYVEGDARTNERTAAKGAMLVLLYSLGKASFNMLARLFDMWPSQVYRRVAKEGLSLPEQGVQGGIKEIGFDGMRRFVVGKAHTVAVERDNSDTRHHLARFTRRTRVVSKKAGMVDLTLRLWQAPTSEPWFTKYRTLALSIYR